MRRPVLDCGAMSAFRGIADITARGDSTGLVANDPKLLSARAIEKVIRFIASSSTCVSIEWTGGIS
jgi:hypothetical protein